MIDSRISLVKNLVLEAGKRLDKIFVQSVGSMVQVKPDKSFVTEQDKNTEKFLVDNLKAKFSEDGFLGEEGAGIEGSTGFNWIIDPIDGTTNYIYRLPLYSISVGLLKDNVIVGGIIYLPSLHKLYSVKKENGFYTDSKLHHTSNTQNLSDTLTIFSIAHKPFLADINRYLYPIVFSNVRKVRIFGAVAMELVQVALGLVDAVVNIGSYPWDVTAGILMVREAGGKALDFDGNDWTDKSKTLIACNKGLALKFVDLFKKNNVQYP